MRSDNRNDRRIGFCGRSCCPRSLGRAQKLTPIRPPPILPAGFKRVHDLRRDLLRHAEHGTSYQQMMFAPAAEKAQSRHYHPPAARIPALVRAEKAAAKPQAPFDADNHQKIGAPRDRFFYTVPVSVANLTPVAPLGHLEHTFLDRPPDRSDRDCSTAEKYGQNIPSAAFPAR